MDPIIEEGYARLLEVIEDLRAKNEESAETIRENSGALLGKMAADAAPVISRSGLRCSGAQRGKHPATSTIRSFTRRR